LTYAGPMRLAAIAGLAGVVMTGCGVSVHVSTGDHAIDIGKLRRAITTSILTDNHVRTMVTCPAHPPFDKGSRFTCVAHLAVGTYPVTVRVLDGDGHVHYGNSAPLEVLDSRIVERSIANTLLLQRHVRASVRCPSPVLERQGLGFTCTASVSGVDRPIDVTQTNATGHVEYHER
jgi:hypothetical protein